MTTLYCDLSHHDWDGTKGEIGWESIRKATSAAVCIRATYGDPAGWNRETRHHADMQAGAKAAGFTLRGSYHNLVKGDAASIARQVDWLRREMDATGASWGMADVEHYPELVTADMWPRWDDVQQFSDRWNAVEQRVMAWYIPKWMWSSYLGKPDLRGLEGPLVQSHYSSATGGPWTIYDATGGDFGTGWDDLYGGRLPDIWQFTSKAAVPGGDGTTDVNAFRGSFTELSNLLAPGADMALEAADITKIADAVMNHKWMQAAIWRIDALTVGADKVRGGPTGPVNLNGAETMWTVQQLKTLASAVAQVDDATVGGLAGKLDAILAAAQDDGDVSVQLPPDAITALQEIKAAITAVPGAVADEQAARLAD